MALPLNEIQTAVVTALRADSGVRTAMTGSSSPTYNIFDNVPTNQVYPYLYIGDIQGARGTLLVMGTKAMDAILSIHIFSATPGFAEAQAIATAIDNVLNEHKLTLANSFYNVRTFFDMYVPKVEDNGPDGKTRHGVLRYRLWNSGG